MILLSCISEEGPVAVQQSDTSLAIQEARTWFGAEEEFVVQGGLFKSNRVNTQLKKLDWKKSLVHEGSNVIEVELDYNYHGVPTNGEKSTEEIREKQKKSFYRMILIPEENGEYSGAILKFFPDQGITDQDNILLNNYSTVSPEYSGKVELVTWDETLIKGWRIKNGVVIKYITPAKQLTGKRNNGSIQSRGGCTTYTERDCITYQGVTDCYDNIPVVECDEDQDADEYSEGGGSSRPTFSSTKWHGFSPGFSTGGASSEQKLQNYIAGIKDPDAKRKAQLEYLKTHGGSQFVGLVNELLAVSGLKMGDIAEINKIVNNVYLQQKGKFMMAIFSPENLSQILLLYSSNISTALRNKVFSTVPKYAVKESSKILLPLGRGSTGRVVANNLTEKLAMKEIMSNPTLGKTVITGLKDSRWLGWNKMQYIHTAMNGTKTTIHYVGKFEKGVLKYVDDFKFN